MKFIGNDHSFWFLISGFTTTLQPPTELRIQRRIELLLHVAKSAEARPDRAHVGNVKRCESVKRIGDEMEDAVVRLCETISPRAIEFLVAQEYAAGDDPRFELKEHERPRRRVQAGLLIRPATVAVGQIAHEHARLDVVDASATEARDLFTHREDADGWHGARHAHAGY